MLIIHCPVNAVKISNRRITSMLSKKIPEARLSDRLTIAGSVDPSATSAMIVDVSYLFLIFECQKTINRRFTATVNLNITVT
jgi:hypothetical protein